MQYLEKELSQTTATVICHLILLLFAPTIINIKETFCCHDGTLAFLFISVISNRVFVAGNVNCEKTHSRSLCIRIGVHVPNWVTLSESGAR